MDRIWANRLIAGTQAWEDVPMKRRQGVTEELAARVLAGEITQECMDEIVGG